MDEIKQARADLMKAYDAQPSDKEVLKALRDVKAAQETYKSRTKEVSVAMLEKQDSAPDSQATDAPADAQPAPAPDSQPAPAREPEDARSETLSELEVRESAEARASLAEEGPDSCAQWREASALPEPARSDREIEGHKAELRQRRKKANKAIQKSVQAMNEKTDGTVAIVGSLTVACLAVTFVTGLYILNQV